MKPPRPGRWISQKDARRKLVVEEVTEADADFFLVVYVEESKRADPHAERFEATSDEWEILVKTHRLIPA